MITTSVLSAVAKVLAHEPLTVHELDNLVTSIPLPLNRDLTAGPFFNQYGTYGEFTLVAPMESTDEIIIEWTLNDRDDRRPLRRTYSLNNQSGAWPLAYLRAVSWFVIDEDGLP